MRQKTTEKQLRNECIGAMEVEEHGLKYGESEQDFTEWNEGGGERPVLPFLKANVQIPADPLGMPIAGAKLFTTPALRGCSRS